MFTCTSVVRLHHTDAAGRLFFAKQFEIMHDAYEEFMADLGFPLREIIDSAPFALAIARAEADFAAPIGLGDALRIGITVEKIGATSYTIAYTVTIDGSGAAGSGKTIHVCVDKTTGKSVGLPEALVKALGAR